jgi:hypothetical protein
MSDNNQSKSLLAKLLATENITMQRSPDAHTAWFDIKNRVLTLPVWQNISNDLEDMLVVHEVGHALDTPMDSWKNAVENISKKVYGKSNPMIEDRIRGFLNVVEDARIDKRQKRRYPGSRRNYLIGYKELMDRDFFGTAKREINSFPFIDRLNMYFKGGFNIGIKFSPEEMPFVKKAEALETFADVEKLTEEIFIYAKEKGEEQQQQKLDTLRMGKGSDEDDGDEESFGTTGQYGEEDDDGDSNSDGDIGDEDADEDDEDADDTSNAGRGEGDEDADQDGKESDVTSAGGKNDEFIPESETEKAWQNKQSEIVANDGTRYNYVTVPKPVIKNIVHDYKRFLSENRTYYASTNFRFDDKWFNAIREEMTKFRTDDNATISFMVKEFEMKKSADIFSRISIAKTGVLDTNKLYSYKYNEDIFRRQAIVPNGKNHGFVMILDWSGSMITNIRDTLKQLISLTAFCKRTQIPFEVYTFRDVRQNDHSGAPFEYKNGDLLFGDLTLRNILSSRMRSAELLEAYQILWAMARCQSAYDSMGSTPLNAAIVAADELVKQFKITSKAQIVNVIFLTDGDSNPVSSVAGGEKFSRWNDAGKRIKNKFIMQDKETGKDYYFTTEEYNNFLNGREVTINLLKRLKDRTGCNLIGFYLYGSNGFRTLRNEFYGYGSLDMKFEEAQKKSWSENKFISVSNHGYDEYYVLNTNAMRDTENKLTVNSEMTKAKIAKEFMKFSEKKSINRVLLKRFIDKVA